MARIYDSVYFKDCVVPLAAAQLSVASSAVLYGLSVYTVFPVIVAESGEKLAFRLDEHYKRLVNSARIIGIDTFEPTWPKERFLKVIQELVAANDITETVFIRATVHVDELLPGIRSRGLQTTVSMFIYEALSILPSSGARLKTSVWRRIPDYAIPSRAKVNGAYVNSVLAKQDALDSGYDDCIFLDVDGHVCELSAANIFVVRDGTLLTPDITSDLLEGISRKTVIEIAADSGLKVVERSIDLTELYIADEIFACGTSAYIAPIIEIDARKIGGSVPGLVTTRVSKLYAEILCGKQTRYRHFLTPLT